MPTTLGRTQEEIDFDNIWAQEDGVISHEEAEATRLNQTNPLNQDDAFGGSEFE